jgi:hypothetical protein
MQIAWIRSLSLMDKVFATPADPGFCNLHVRLPVVSTVLISALPKIPIAIEVNSLFQICSSVSKAQVSSISIVDLRKSMSETNQCDQHPDEHK